MTMICIDCVTPEPLKRLVALHGCWKTCVYCGNGKTAVTHGRLFDYIFERVKENFATEDDLSEFEHAMTYMGGADDIPVQTIDVVLSEWLGLGDEVYFNDLCGAVPPELKTNHRGNETHFCVDDGLLERNFYAESWATFIDGIQHTHRFFNPIARSFLDSVFSFLIAEEGVLKPECILVINNGEYVYRARSVNGYTEAQKFVADPVREFGPAPRSKAGNQRMTPAGISALYCALNRATCLSEIRSITGDRVVSIALTPTTELKLLDLTHLQCVEPAQVVNLEVGYLKAMHLKTFIKSLVKKLSRPKGRTDELSYLSTQVVFEYLRLRFGAQVDGIAIPSVQTGEVGTNVVLFPEASVIDSMLTSAAVEPSKVDDGELPKGSQPRAKLSVVTGSFLFHNVIAVETRAETYGNVRGAFMGELEQRQWGQMFARHLADPRGGTEG